MALKTRAGGFTLVAPAQYTAGQVIVLNNVGYQIPHDAEAGDLISIHPWVDGEAEKASAATAHATGDQVRYNIANQNVEEGAVTPGSHVGVTVSEASASGKATVRVYMPQLV